MARSGTPPGLAAMPLGTPSGIPTGLSGTPFGLVAGSLNTVSGLPGVPLDSGGTPSGLPRWSSKSTQTLPFERGPSRSVSSSPRSIIRLMVEIDTPRCSAAAILLYRRLFTFPSPAGHGMPNGNPRAGVVAHAETDGVGAVCSAGKSELLAPSQVAVELVHSGALDADRAAATVHQPCVGAVALEVWPESHTFSIWGITPGAVGELVLTFPAVTAVAELLAAPGAGGRSVLHRVLPPLQTSLGIEKGPT